jgi:Skp family chaperone for outer membrane proteins
MKRMVLLSTFTCFAMICACQKQDSAAEAQLAQRKAELDTREKALDEREKALVEREKAITKFRPIPSNRPIPSDLQSRRLALDPEHAKAERERRIQQAEAEREKRIQQLPPEIQTLIPHRSLSDPGTAEKGMAIPDRAERLRRLEEERRNVSATPSPSAESSDTPPSSPSPSPTPE